MAERGTPSVYTARGQVDGEDWPAVAAALNERMAARRIGQQELARLSGVSVSTLRMLQHGASRRVQNKTLEAIARALDWPEDHLIDILVTAHQPASLRQPHDEPTAVVLSRIEWQLRDVSDRLARVESYLQAEQPPGSAPGR
ncbi:helix-turn-helix transcriptional regulator [Kineosporia sp. J2-2]|uniref:Helix-turn-helix transcriptional regulator n=1 Tax=Kineosporia corallincola TaxID=2835133 RepID=A0ABS5TQJ9_9ACTN|nr:helix-turn-helix transcriptional regulator [Kineosporia corallincola]MBT0773168.1 helix-turn-helix transcriptional regulator [Kineosporia corallincola]